MHHSNPAWTLNENPMDILLPLLFKHDPSIKCSPFCRAKLNNNCSNPGCFHQLRKPSSHIARTHPGRPGIKRQWLPMSSWHCPPATLTQYMLQRSCCFSETATRGKVGAVHPACPLEHKASPIYQPLQTSSQWAQQFKRDNCTGSTYPNQRILDFHAPHFFTAPCSQESLFCCETISFISTDNVTLTE